ncbi:MAG: methionine--tRNA ligase [Candidatus Thermochlorobacter sp.]
MPASNTKSFKRTLVTTALPYANGPLHLGHLTGTYIPADIFVRYKRLRGEDILHIGGSDEHGVPITIQADKEGVSPKDIVDRYHTLHRAVLKKLNIAIDNFSRTSLPIHHQTTQEFFLDFERRGILTKKLEQQFYDEAKHQFLPDRYVVGECPVCHYPEANGDQCENCGTYLSATELINPKSKLSGNTPVLKETLHWYFPLGKYQDFVEELVSKHEHDWRPNVVNYARTWLKQGLGERAITRDLSWGVPVPLDSDEAKGKVIYVWFDAVLGYISSTKEWAQQQGQPEKWREYWQREDARLIHFIGKDNVVFHAIMFPAMLKAWNDAHPEAQYVIVDNIPASEFINIEGKKFSKSRGYAVYAHEFLEKFPADTLRYILAVNYPENHDSDFSWKDFQNRVNGELADTLGNFVKRAVDFTNSKFEGIVPANCSPHDWNSIGIDWQKTFDELEHAFEGFHIREAVFQAMELARTANKFLTDQAPWKTYKTDLEQSAKAISISLNLCHSLAIIFSPILPDACDHIFKMLNLDERNWENAKQPKLQAGHRLSGTSVALFRKIEDKDIAPELEKIEQLVQEAAEKERAKAMQAHTTQTAISDLKPTITIEDFEKLDLRVATVVAAEKVPRADKLLKLTLKLGPEERVILAGIAEHYAPEEMIGKNVVVVANLAPRKMRGIESQGMLLAVTGSDGKVHVVEPTGEGINGMPVK